MKSDGIIANDGVMVELNIMKEQQYKKRLIRYPSESENLKRARESLTQLQSITQVQQIHIEAMALSRTSLYVSVKQTVYIDKVAIIIQKITIGTKVQKTQVKMSGTTGLRLNRNHDGITKHFRRIARGATSGCSAQQYVCVCQSACLQSKGCIKS